MSVNTKPPEPSRQEIDPGAGAPVWLEAARLAADKGDFDDAGLLLDAVSQVDPNSIDALLGLAWLAKTPQEREALLSQVLALEPDNAKAQAELERHHAESSQPEAVQSESEPESSGVSIWGWLGAAIVLTIGIALAAILFFGPIDSSMAGFLATATPTPTPAPTLTPSQVAARFVPELESAVSTGNWERALELISIMESVDPKGEVVLKWSRYTFVEYGKALVADRQAPDALDQFDQALARAPEDAEARLWQQTTQSYLAAREALDADQWDAGIRFLNSVLEQIPEYGDAFNRLVGAYKHQAEEAAESKDWTQVIESLTEARELLPEDPEVAGELALAYRERGIVEQETGKLQKAKTDLEAALDLQPGDKRAKNHLAEVMYILHPPKRIVIDISKQRLWAYEGDQLVYKWLCSTGLKGRDTAAGNFQVLDKIRMAYSKVWQLKMPYWLGIYYVGGIENGIHALPIRPDGSVMWGGLLGQRASYGCIILSKNAAKTLYNWAEIGTAVEIRH